MARATLEEIKLKADEYGKLAKQIARAEKAREAEMAPIVERHAGELQPVLDKHDGRIDKLQVKAAEIADEVTRWLDSKKNNYTAESELTTFGVEVASKQGPRVIRDFAKLTALCKRKGIEVWEIAKVLVEKADDLLGKKEVDAISERPLSPTRRVFLKLKD